MRENEFKDYYNNYIINQNVAFDGENDEIYNNIFSNLIYFEHPDAYSIDKKNKIIYIIEHFRISSSYFNEKCGEEFIKNKADLLKKLRNLKLIDINTSNEKEMYKMQSKSRTERLNVNCSLENYINNFKRTLEHHYGQIEKYKKDLKKCINTNDEYDYKTLFIIEDSSPLGVTYKDERFDIMNFKRFINILKNKEKIDYIMFTNPCKSCLEGELVQTKFYNLNEIDFSKRKTKNIIKNYINFYENCYCFCCELNFEKNK